MRAPGAALFPIGILSLLAALTFWLQRATQGEDAVKNNERHDPDFFVEHFTVKRFDNTGALRHTLTAGRMDHFPDDDSTLVDNPHFIYSGERQTRLTADRAWLDKEGKHIRLEDNVRVLRPAVADSPETTMTTSLLNVVPDDEYAQTDQPVTITQGRSVLHGRGLEINRKTQVMVLSGPVQGTIYRKDTP